LSYTISTGQTITQKDSNSVIIVKNEFKFIIERFAELESVKKTNLLLNSEIRINKFIGDAKDSMLIAKERTIEKYSSFVKEQQKQIIENSSFWNKNKFYLGAATGIAVSVVLFFLAN